MLLALSARADGSAIGNHIRHGSIAPGPGKCPGETERLDPKACHPALPSRLAPGNCPGLPPRLDPKNSPELPPKEGGPSPARLATGGMTSEAMVGSEALDPAAGSADGAAWAATETSTAC